MNGTISSYCAERGRNTFQTTNGLARMAEAEFEAQLQDSAASLDLDLRFQSVAIAACRRGERAEISW